jgi:glycosyltransferase involved in cell wall biosynthesis
MLEALATGTFPIQSGTACTDEWFVDGETGFAVPPEDPHAVAQALRRALADDALVDSAAIRNAQVCAARLDSVTIRAQTIALYERVLKENNQL